MPIEKTDPANLTQETQNLTCPNCSVSITDTERFCHHCGHALTPPAENNPVSAPVAVTPRRPPIPDPAIAKGIKQARTALLVVAIIQVLAGSLFALLQVHDTFAIVGVFIIAAIFWGLWFWAENNPLPATIAGLVTFITVHIADAMIDPKQLFQGLIMKILVVVFLVKGVNAGLNHRNAQKRLEHDQANQP